MKVLVISNLYPPHYIGGYELHCAAIVEALRERGHDVEVLTSNHGLDAESPADATTGVERTLRVHGHFGHPWLGIRQLTKLEGHNNQMLRRAVDRVQPDVVYVWNLGGLSKSLLFTLSRMGLPVAFYVSDHWIARSLKADVWLSWWNRSSKASPSGLLRSLYSKLGWRSQWDAMAPTAPVESARFRRIAFCSKALRSITGAKGYGVGHGTIIHCLVNTERYSGNPALAEKPTKQLLYVGRLSEDKGVLTTLKAMALVKGKFDGSLSLYGKGDADYVAMLQKFVEDEALPVTFHSASPSQMPEVYAAHDALLFPSEWEEPFAITPLEAMAAGLPVIGTMTGGSSELFRHAENALTYDAGDAAMLARRILELSADSALRVKIATAGQADVRRLCAETVLADQHALFLKETSEQWESPAAGLSNVPVLSKAA